MLGIRCGRFTWRLWGLAAGLLLSSVLQASEKVTYDESMLLGQWGNLPFEHGVAYAENELLAIFEPAKFTLWDRQDIIRVGGRSQMRFEESSVILHVEIGGELRRYAKVNFSKRDLIEFCLLFAPRSERFCVTMQLLEARPPLDG